jgi:hypothetical protein
VKLKRRWGTKAGFAPYCISNGNANREMGGKVGAVEKKQGAFLGLEQTCFIHGHLKLVGQK